MKKMKSITKLIIILIFGLILVGCQDQPIPSDSVAASQSENTPSISEPSSTVKEEATNPTEVVPSSPTETIPSESEPVGTEPEPTEVIPSETGPSVIEPTPSESEIIPSDPTEVIPSESLSDVEKAIMLFEDSQLVIFIYPGESFNYVSENFFILNNLSNYSLVWESSNENVVIHEGQGIIKRLVNNYDVTLSVSMVDNEEVLATKEYTLTIIASDDVSRVSFDLDGGTLNIEEYVVVLNGDLVDNPGSPVKEDYNFIGWYYLDEEYLFDIVVTQDITLVAKYELKPPPVDPKYGQYYDDITAVSGDSLFNQLNELISYKRYIGQAPTPLGAGGEGNINYGDVRYLLLESDIHPDDPNKLWGIYDNAKITNSWGGGDIFQREHVWPNSRLGIARVANSNRNQGSDPHNLRAIIGDTNSTRGNRFFVEGSGIDGYTIPNNEYYPGDAHRGDVARILLYMAVRYKDILTLVESPSGANYTLEGANFGNIKVLLNWHLEDPVDQFEVDRNLVIYSWQGNRNPFIDKPEYFEPIWNYLQEEESARQRDLSRYYNTLNQLSNNQKNYLFERENSYFN